MSADPKRLLEDPGTMGLLRSDLAAAKDAEVGYDAAAGLARLQAAIAAPPPPPAPSGSGAAAAGGGKAALWFGAGALAIIGAAAIIAITRPEPPKPVATSARVVASAAPESPKPSASEDVPTVDLSTLPVEKAPVVAAPSASTLSPEERLRAEMKDLAEIRSALGSSPSQALERANQGHQKFKGGLFYQEREALAISALVKLGRGAEAKSRAQQFLASFPKGPYAERIRKETGL